MAEELPTPTPASPDGMKRFVADQVEAVRIARAEDGSRASLRVDACHLAMRFLGDVQCGAAGSTVHDVIRMARQFEQYLSEP